jgi:hypothetical protein
MATRRYDRSLLPWGPSPTQTPRDSEITAIRDDWQMYGGQVLLTDCAMS